MITPYELNMFQECRWKWKLMQRSGHSRPMLDTYTQALRKTIFQMYSWLLDRDKLITDKQVRERWDKNWWQTALTEGIDQKTIMEYTLKGWTMLEDYWECIYLAEPTVYPVAINMEFSCYIHNVHFRIPVDLLLGDKDNRIILRQLGTNQTERQLYYGLETRLELVGLAQTLQRSLTSKSHINLNKPSQHPAGPEQIIITPTPEYTDESLRLIDDIARSISSNSIYPAMGHSCIDCPFDNRCPASQS